MKKTNSYWIYILQCENGSYYTGYTNDLDKRFQQHMNGSAGAKYTRSFKPKRIAQSWKLKGTKGTALKIEHMIKGMDRKTKDLIVEDPDKLKDIINDKLSLNVNLISFNPEIGERE